MRKRGKGVPPSLAASRSMVAAALNVMINLNALADSDFIGWKSDEVGSLLKTSRMMAEETMEMVSAKMRIFRAPEFLGTAFLLAVLAMLVHVLLER